MRMTRGKALTYHAALSAIANGNGKAPDIDGPEYLLILKMLSCLEDEKENFNKASSARFAFFAAGNTTKDQNGSVQIGDPEKALAYDNEVRTMRDAEISVRMPKDRISVDSLHTKENGFTANLLALVAPFLDDQVEMDEG